MKIAAIDVGSNSIKLVVVDAAASDSLACSLAKRKRCGWATIRFNRSVWSPDAIGRAVDCIKRFRSIAEARGAERIFAELLRRFAKPAILSVHQRSERKAGVSVEVLSAIEEGRLIGLAASQSLCRTRCFAAQRRYWRRLDGDLADARRRTDQPVFLSSSEPSDSPSNSFSMTRPSQKS